MRKSETRGIPIGAVTSQTIGNLAASAIDHRMKIDKRKSAYFRYCDDVLGLTRTKAEAVRQLREFHSIASEAGLVVKANAVVSPIGINVASHGKSRRHRRKRQRGGRGKKH